MIDILNDFNYIKKRNRYNGNAMFKNHLFYLPKVLLFPLWFNGSNSSMASEYLDALGVLGDAPMQWLQLNI